MPSAPACVVGHPLLPRPAPSSASGLPWDGVCVALGLQASRLPLGLSLPLGGQLQPLSANLLLSASASARLLSQTPLHAWAFQRNRLLPRPLPLGGLRSYVPSSAPLPASLYPELPGWGPLQPPLRAAISWFY